MYVRYDPANPLSVRVYDMETDKYLWTWELANELMLPYLVDKNDEASKDDIANAERVINENKRVIKQISKGVTDALDPDKQIDILKLMVQKGVEGKEKFKPELPRTFVPVFSEERLEEKPELSNIEKITVALDQINLAASARKGK